MTSVRSSSPRLVFGALGLLGAALLAAPSSAWAAASAPADTALGAAPGGASSAGSDFYAGYLRPHATARYCFHFGNHQYEGPVAVTATASEYGVVLAVTSTDLQYRDGLGWVSCTTVHNASTTGAGVTLSPRSALTAAYRYSAYVGTLAAGATGRYCFHFGTADQGPVVATAIPTAVGATLRTVSTDLEDRQGYAWTYCSTVKNISTTSTGVGMDAQTGLTSVSYYDGYVGYLPGGATGRWCFNAPSRAVPVAVDAAASEYATVLQTVSTDRENRLGYGLVYCATIRNASPTGSGVTLEARDGL